MGGSGTTDSRTASVDDESATSAAVRDVLRYWAGDQARWARLLANLTADDPSTDVFLRTSPPAADTFCAKSAGASRTPIDASALAHGVMTGRGEYSHQYVYWMNDMMRSAFRAQGHGVIDVETMLGVRVDAYPCSKDGAGDKLHFCQPGPVDWALDVMVRQTHAAPPPSPRSMPPEGRGERDVRLRCRLPPATGGGYLSMCRRVYKVFYRFTVLSVSQTTLYGTVWEA